MQVTYGEGFLSARKKVENLQAELQKLSVGSFELNHYFAPGIYAREMRVPAGTTLTGAVHKTCHLCILSQGRVRVFGQGGTHDLSAPSIIRSEPGEKRAIYVYEDAVWTNIHATNETDIEKLVSELTESTSQELVGGSQNPQTRMIERKEV